MNPPAGRCGAGRPTQRCGGALGRFYPPEQPIPWWVYPLVAVVVLALLAVWLVRH